MIKPLKLNDTMITRVAAASTLLLFVYEVYAVGVNYSDYFLYLQDSETIIFAVIGIVLFLASFYVFFRAVEFILSASWPYRLVSLLIFATALFVEYGYQKALGRFSTRLDIESAIGTTTDQQLATVSMYLNLRAIIPLALLLVLLYFVRPEKNVALKSFLLTNVLFIALFAISPMIVDQKFPTISTAAFYRTATDFLINGPVRNGKWGSGLTGIDLRRREVKKPPVPDDYRPKNNVVVILDESVRGDHLSLNGYPRETTPFLSKLNERGILHNWGIAVAASTGSRFTFNALVAGLTPYDFPDSSELKINTFPTIFQYAKAMNYKVQYFDGQMHSFWIGIDDDRRFFDSWRGVLDISEGKEFETWELDNIIARKVKTIIAGSTGNFIFVFKHGVHIPYQSNFPPNQEYWSPSYHTENKFDIPSGSQLPAVANAYDNGLRYNLDSFFQNLVDDYSTIPNKTVFVYTGDHGQTLFANGRSSHGGSTKEEAGVPLFIVGDIGRPVDTSYKASHQNIFPTVLDLFEYPDELREFKSAPSLLKAKGSDSKPRFFNPDLGLRVAFDQ